MHQILKYRLTCVLQGLTPALISRYSQLSIPMGSASNQPTAYVFSIYFFLSLFLKQCSVKELNSICIVLQCISNMRIENYKVCQRIHSYMQNPILYKNFI